MTNLTEQQVREIIRNELREFLGSDRYIFQKHIQLFDGRNIQTGRTTGTKIATNTDQKLAFYGTTPVDKPETISDVSSGSVSGADTVSLSTIQTQFSNYATAINTLIDRLQELGLIK